jgi:hypothetical protein
LYDDLPKTRAEAIAAGAPRYFTGKPCKHGHVAPRYAGGGCVECIIARASTARWWQNNREKEIYRKAKARAKAKGILFTISPEDIVIPSRCPVFGIDLRFGGRQGIDHSPSLDRIVPANGYVRGNVAVISNRANAIKRDGTAEEHRRIAEWMEKQTSERSTFTPKLPYVDVVGCDGENVRMEVVDSGVQRSTQSGAEDDVFAYVQLRVSLKGWSRELVKRRFGVDL